MRTRASHAIHTFPLAVRPVIVPTTVGVTIIVLDESEIPSGHPGQASHVVLFTELAHVNSGRSITNAIEDVASAARRLLNDPYGRPLSAVDPGSIVWVEVYSGALSYGANSTKLTVDWVDLEWRGTHYRNPQWTRIVDRFIKDHNHIPIPAHLARRLEWMGVDLQTSLMAEAEKAEAAFHVELRNRPDMQTDTSILETNP